MSRSTQIRRLVTALEAVTGVRVEAYYTADSVRPWRLSWDNGPTYTTMDGLLGQHAPAGVGPAIFACWRVVQDEALALQAVRLALASADRELFAYKSDLRRAIETAAHTTDYPDRPLDEREATLAARLLAAVDHGGEGKMAEELQAGIARLLEEDLATPRPGDHAWAGEHLTARYAHHRRYASAGYGQAWRRHLATMPARELVAAVRQDPDADQSARLAALTLVPLARAEIEADLAALDEDQLHLADQIRAEGAPWATIGEALELTRQGAEQSVQRIRKRTASTTR